MDQWENQFYEHLSGRLGWASHKRSGIIGLRTQIQAELNIFLSRAPGSSRIKPDQSLSLSVLQVPEEEKLNKCLYPYKIYIYIYMHLLQIGKPHSLGCSLQKRWSFLVQPSLVYRKGVCFLPTVLFTNHEKNQGKWTSKHGT